MGFLDIRPGSPTVRFDLGGGDLMYPYYRSITALLGLPRLFQVLGRLTRALLGTPPRNGGRRPPDFSPFDRLTLDTSARATSQPQHDVYVAFLSYAAATS